jgi:hypothetical protein
MKKSYYRMGVAMTLGMLATSGSAHAAAGGQGGNTFSDISENIAGSIESVPGLLSALAYLVGILLAVLGIMKIKDHVDNPSQNHLKDGIIRLVAGGGLFAIPIISEAMLTTIGEGDAVSAAKLNKVQFEFAGGGGP